MMNIDIGFMRELDALPRNKRVLEAALYYASMGQKVIPQIGKAPQVKEADASSDPMTIRRWFGPGGAFEGQNVGLVLEGCRVLDLDRHGGKDGVKALGVPVDQLACPREATPGDGFHLLIAHMDLRGKPDQGIDIKTRITTWPSEVEGKQYKWETGGEPGRLNGTVIMKLGGRQIQSAAASNAFSSKFTPIAPASYINFYLEHIDPDIDYDSWLKIGMGIHGNDDSPDSLAVWVDWSRGGSKFKEGECEKKWATFTHDRNKPVTLRWLISEAKKNGAGAHEHDDIYYQSFGATIAALNETYAFYAGSGDPRAVWVNNRGEFCFSRPAALEIILANQPIIHNGKAISAAKAWFGSPERRVADHLGMWPPGKEPAKSMNAWTGVAIPPVECEESELRDFFEFCVEDICRGNKKYADYLWDLMATKIQNPLKLIGIALVISGGEGTGKGLLTGTIGQIIGPNHSRLVTSRDWVGPYGGDLIASAVFVEAHEASWSGNHTEAGRLKAFMSEKKIDWGGKFKPGWSSPNYMFVSITTNEDWAVPAGMDSRRFFVLKSSDKRQKDDKHWDKMASLIGVDRETGEPINPEYLGKIRYWLEHRKVKSTFSRAMETEWLVKQRKETALESRDDLFLRWVRATFCVESAFAFQRPGGQGHQRWQIKDDEGVYAKTQAMAEDYRDFVTKHGKRNRSVFDDGTLYEKMASIGLTVKRYRKHRIIEGGKALSDAFSESKVSAMYVPSPDTIEQNIAQMFPLFGVQNDDDDSDN